MSDAVDEVAALGAELISDICRLRQEARVASIVLDDDPTGSQTVHDISVELSVDDLELASTLGDERRAFVLTNTRSMHSTDAVLTTRRAVEAAYAALAAGESLQIVSRSDSTLRGHVLAEVNTLQQVRREHVGKPYHAVVFAPAFPEAGRITVRGQHFVVTPDGDIPVGETEYARDTAFGYRSSALRDFLVETGAGLVRPQDIIAIDLDDIRTGGPTRVHDVLADAQGRWVVVDSLHTRDMEVVAKGITLAQRAGIDSLVRSGPSLVRPLLGVSGAKLYRPRLAAGGDVGGLIVVGSHTDTTNRQVARLHDGRQVTTVVLSVPALLAGDTAVLSQAAEKVADALRSGTALLMTSRDVVGRDSAGESLRVARSVSAAVAQIVGEVRGIIVPRWVICKGGITSHDVTVSGLGVKRARVLGQLFPGQVSVFRQLPGEEGYPHEFVIFPGNVGAEDTLLRAASIMEGDDVS